MNSFSAPGKIILFGEHAVVYGRPALAVPVTQLQATVTITPATVSGIHIEAPDIHLSSPLASLPTHHPLAAAVALVLAELGQPVPPPLVISIHSTIPVASGLGSGTAVSVALIRALSASLGKPLAVEAVSRLAFELEILHHGTPSGIDNTVISFNRPVYFVRAKPVEILRLPLPFTLIIANTGIPALTKDSVADVRKLWLSDRVHFENIFDSIGQIAAQARRCLLSGDVQALGPLMDRNQALLASLSVSSPELEHLIHAARQAGAIGAKLSGGGRGGNILALANPENTAAVAQALEAAGAVQVLHTTIS